MNKILHLGSPLPLLHTLVGDLIKDGGGFLHREVNVHAETEQSLDTGPMLTPLIPHFPQCFPVLQFDNF